MELIKRLEKCCCKIIDYEFEENKYYKLHLIYDKKHYRFFALTFKKLEIMSLKEMRMINRGEQYDN